MSLAGAVSEVHFMLEQSGETCGMLWRSPVTGSLVGDGGDPVVGVVCALAHLGDVGSGV